MSVLNLSCQQVFIEIDDDGSETITSNELEAGCLWGIFSCIYGDEKLWCDGDLLLVILMVIYIMH